LLSVEEGLSFQGAKTGMKFRVVLDTWKILPRYWRTFVRSSFIGFWMGFKPGGATPGVVHELRVCKTLLKECRSLR
jgi:putative tricarboxylic transport membrane protein